MKSLTTVLHPLLNNPLVFEMQERIFNNYDAVGREFDDYLHGALDILDVGCSTGACAAQIIDFTRHRYIGIDIDRSYVELAAARRKGGRFLAMDCRTLSFPDASFDRALFVGVLHHIPDDIVRQCLSELTRVLRPGGYVLVAEPLIVPERRVSHFFLKLDRGHYIRTKPGYESLFDGFEIERRRTFQLSFHCFASYVLRRSA